MNQNMAAERVQTPFDALGEAGVRKLVDAFYDAMENDPAASALRAIHQADLSPMRDRLSDWLVGWLGGPQVYAIRHPGRPCIVSAHAGVQIGPEAAAQWMACMRKAFADTGMEARLRGLLEPAFERMCQALMTR